ncbi:MAG: class I SAM-dependent methyltransferase [Acidimicrobiales bacterium]
MERDRRDIFGEAVDEYVKARPGYPDDMVDDVLSYADPVGDIIEVGAGTGKATVAFAARGIAMTCLEPDARMAARLAHECAAYPQVTIEVTRLENYSRPLAFDALIAAQSWHWVDPVRRWDLAHDAVRTGGAVALFWNKYIVADDATRSDLADIDKHYHVEYGVNGITIDQNEGEIELEEGWPAHDLANDSRFEDLVSRRYRRQMEYSAATYVDLLTSTSAYRMLDALTREQLFEEVRIVLERRKGPLSMNIVTDLFLARTTPLD